MKKFILPLMLLLLAAGLLFAVESDPSAVVGYVKYDCIVGRNLVALPMDQDYELASEIGTAYAGLVDAISYWNASAQSWDNAVYYSEIEMWDPDFAVEPGSVLMINALSPYAFYSIGDMPAQNAQYPLITGRNTLMVPLNRSDLTLASGLGTDIGSVDAVSKWDAPTQTWDNAVYYSEIEMWDPDFGVTIGMPLMTNVLTAGQWPTRAGRTGNFGLKQSNNQEMK